PVYELPAGNTFAEAMGKVGLTIATTIDLTESSALCKVVAPVHHLFESWGDAEPVRGHVSMIQPTIAPLFDSRQREHSLLTWIGGEQPLFQQEQPYYEYLRNRWSAVTGSATAWNTLLHDGVYTYTPPASGASYRDNLAALAGKITK